MRLSSIKDWFLQAIQLQLFVTLWSFPFLVAWGLPISGMTIIGNFLFIPFLILFLILSTLILLAELVHLPSTIPIILLEWCTTFWFILLHLGSPTWLKGFIKPSMIILIAFPLITTLFLYFRWSSPIQRRVVVISSMLVLFISFLYLQSRHTFFIKEIPCADGHVTLLCINNQVAVIDPGVIAHKQNPYSWIEYTLNPELRKHCGDCAINHVIALKPSKRLFQALIDLSYERTIENIYLPSWQGFLEPEAHILFNDIQELCAKKNIRINQLSSSCGIHINATTSLFITALDKYTRSCGVKYNRWQITIHHKNQNIGLAQTITKKGIKYV